MGWKGTGEMINTKFFCRLCSLLHEPRSIKPGHHYEDFNEWWRGKGTCINGSWNKFKAALKKDSDAAAQRKSIANMPKENSEKLDGNGKQEDKIEPDSKISTQDMANDKKKIDRNKQNPDF